MADGAGAPIVPLLTRWGVNADADLVYRALADLGQRTPAGLATELGLSRRRVDSALDQLYMLRIALAPADRNRPWRVADTHDVLATLAARRRPIRRDPSLPIPVANLLRLVPPGREDAEVRYLPTRELTRRRLADVVTRARREHLSIHTEPVFEPAALQAARPLDRSMADRRIPVRTMGVAIPAPIVKSWNVYRPLSTVPMKLLVMDREIAMIPRDQTDLEKGYIEITAAPAVRSLFDLFEKYWQQAETERTAMSRLTLSARETQLIELLATGLTDARAAHQMRISERSVSSIMRC
jgi:hypothetical protein